VIHDRHRLPGFPDHPDRGEPSPRTPAAKVSQGQGLASLVPGRAVPVLLADHLAQHGPPPYGAGFAWASGHGAELAWASGHGAELAWASGHGAAEALAAMVSAPAEPVESVVAVCDAKPEPAKSRSWEEAVPSGDVVTLWLAPHLVLDGLQLTATAVGALGAYIDLGPADSARLRESLRQAIAERDRAALDLVPAQVADDPPGTAAVALTPETLAQVALFARYGRAY
jgi:hypothetical protein